MNNERPPNLQPLLREPSRAANRILTMLDETFLSPVTLAFPNKYFIAFSLLCDIECPYCPRQYYPKLIDHGFMKAEWLEPVIPYLRYAEFTGLFGLGEPFLHPDFFPVLRRVKEAGAQWVATSTHGMTLKPAVREKIIEEGLDELEVSIDGTRPETFDFMRMGAQYETVIENVRALQALKRERGLDRPHVNVACTIGRRNVMDMVPMVDLCVDLGIHQLVITDLIIIDPRNAGESVAEIPLFHDELKKALSRAEASGLDAMYAPQKPFPWLMNHHSGRMADARDPDVLFGCRSAWGEINIERQGAAKPCCYLEGPFGNAFERDMGELKNGEYFQQLREGLVTKRLWKECQSCGRLHSLRRDHVDQQFEMIEAALAKEAEKLEAGEREAILSHLEQFRELAAARFGAAV